MAAHAGEVWVTEVVLCSMLGPKQPDGFYEVSRLRM